MLQFYMLLLLFCCSIVSASLWPHGLQHARLPCLSPTPRTFSNSSIKSVMPFNHLILCHPLSSCLQSFSAAGFFQMSQFCTSIDQSIRASASALIIPINTQDWFPLGLTGLITLQSKGFSRAFSNTKVQKHQFFSTQFSLCSNSNIFTRLLEKP